MSNALPKPKAILFDWDNTLVNTWPVIHAALHHTFLAMGKEPWPLETTKARVRKSMRDSFPEIFGENWEKAGELYQQHYRSNHLENLKPLEGALELLQFLAGTGLFIAVVSNKKGPNLRDEVAHLGWNGYFQRLVGAGDAARDKPFADPVLHVLEATAIQPGPDVWFVGDSDVDLECAKTTGCTALLYGHEAQLHPEFLPGAAGKGRFQGVEFDRFLPTLADGLQFFQQAVK